MEGKKMNYCPECGGDMIYKRVMKRKVCKSCGLSLTTQELIEIKEKSKNPIIEEEERKRIRKEYLKWWLSSKK
jgi:predicted RNA-binding Zn-ribbon protein involved in translation (DUF1610 family)